jgi:hypothetical protein
MGIVKKKFIFVTDIIFRKEHIMNKIYIVLIVGVIILSGIGTVALTDNSTYDVKNLKESFVISEPIIKDVDQYVTVNLEEATSSLLHVGKPVLPVVTRVFTLPFGSKISHVDVIFSEENEIAVSKEVLPGSEPVFVSTESKSLKKTVKDPVVYGNAELYPFSRYSYTTRAGLENKEHVNYLTVRCYPVRYSPKQNIIYYSENVEINVLYKEPSIPTVFPNEYNLVIIAPEEYSAGIQPLVSHKESHNIKTLFKTTEDIYSEYTGRDEPEKIKYFIKEAIENFGASYVLLIGSIYKLPIRTSSVTIWDRWQEDTLTDLYYSDVLDANGDFSSWDSNDS